MGGRHGILNHSPLSVAYYNTNTNFHFIIGYIKSLFIEGMIIHYSPGIVTLLNDLNNTLRWVYFYVVPLEW